MIIALVVVSCLVAFIVYQLYRGDERPGDQFGNHK